MKPKCCLCFCFYNNEEGLPRALSNMNELNAVFDMKIIAYYDYSTDKSLSIVEKYKENHDNIEIIINRNPKHKLRTRNIANARNSLIQRIRDNYANYEYFIMMDTNEYSCVGKIILEPIKEMLLRNDEWDSVSFDRISGYYDTWALSFDPHIYSFFHFENWRDVVEKMREDFNLLLKTSKNSNKDLIPVYSAFNGFAIYKIDKFIECKFSDVINLSLFPENTIKTQVSLVKNNIINNFIGDCEHRHFHLEAIAKNNAKIRICTAYIFDKVPNPRPGLRGPC